MDEAPRPFVLLWAERKVVVVDEDTKTSVPDCY